MANECTRCGGSTNDGGSAGTRVAVGSPFPEEITVGIDGKPELEDRASRQIRDYLSIALCGAFLGILVLVGVYAYQHQDSDLIGDLFDLAKGFLGALIVWLGWKTAAGS